MNEQIKDFGMARMTYGSCNDFHREAILLIEEKTPAALHIEGKMPAYTQTVDTLTGLVERDTAFISTEAIRGADRTRDNGIGTLCLTVDACLTTPVAEKQAAAKLLHPVLAPYRGIARSEYTKETSQIVGMLAKLDQENCTAAIKTLALDGEVAAIREANATFQESMREKRDERKGRAVQTELETKAVVAEANNLYRDIVMTVNAYAIVQPTDEILDFIADMNALVETYALIAESSTGGTPKPDEPTPEPTTPEITKFYPKENANPDRPLDFPRNKTAVLEGKGLKLVDSPEGKKAQLVLINYVDQRMPHEDSAILVNTDEKIEFTMMYDAAEGQYNFQIETYPNGTEEAVVIKYPETITLI